MANNDTVSKEVSGQNLGGQKRKYPDDPVREVFEAARSGNADSVLSELLQHMDASERTSALYLETKTIYGKMVRHLMYRQFRVSSTPLTIASEHGNLDCGKVLLRYKADIESRCSDDDDNGDDNVNVPLLHQG